VRSPDAMIDDRAAAFGLGRPGRLRVAGRLSGG
jgi:hypothetical protein